MSWNYICERPKSNESATKISGYTQQGVLSGKTFILMKSKEKNAHNALEKVCLCVRVKCQVYIPM